MLEDQQNSNNKKALTVAYLINQYPKVSHSFIRREILGVEAKGVRVLRFSIRSRAFELVDQADIREHEKTRYILKSGVSNLVLSFLRVAISRPKNLLNALSLTFKTGWSSDRGIFLNLAYLVEACVLLNWCLAEKVDHIHAHFHTNSTSVAMLCSALGGPTYSFTTHIPPEELEQAKSFSLKEKIERASLVIAISAFGRSQLKRWCEPEDWAKIRLIHCGVDQDFIDDTDIPIASDPRFVCVGRLTEVKGHLVLLEAASQLVTEGLKFKIVLVGDGDLRSKIEAFIERLNLQNYIEIYGWASQTQVREQLIAARAMILPSFSEGLPVAIMEALSLGRPVISTYISGIPELVEPKVGWLIPAGSTEQLVKVMRTALLMPVENLEEMGRNGKEIVATQYNAALEASKLAIMFQELVMGELKETKISLPN